MLGLRDQETVRPGDQETGTSRDQEAARPGNRHSDDRMVPMRLPVFFTGRRTSSCAKWSRSMEEVGQTVRRGMDEWVRRTDRVPRDVALPWPDPHHPVWC